MAFVVDDHPGFGVATRVLLESIGFRVVGVATDGRSALRDLRNTPVDLALVDLYLPGEDGIDIADQIVVEGCARAVVIVSSREDAGADPRVVASAATCFIAKRDLSADRLRQFLP